MIWLEIIGEIQEDFMYCTVEDVRRLLPTAIVVDDPNLGTPVPGRPTANRSDITSDQVRYYISYSQQYIDGRLRPYYVCPLRKVKVYEEKLPSSVTAGTSVNVSVRDSSYFNVGDEIRLQSTDDMETANVTAINSGTSITVDTVAGSYDSTSKISIIKHPDPISIIAARFACGVIIDRLFTADQAPNVSEYGKTQRNLARNDLEDVLTGTVLLLGQNHTGRRFVRGSLFDAFKNPAEFNKGEDKE